VRRSHQLRFDGSFVAMLDESDRPAVLGALIDDRLGGGPEAALFTDRPGLRFLVVLRFLAGARFAAGRRAALRRELVFRAELFRVVRLAGMVSPLAGP